VEDIAYIELDDLAVIEGFGDELAQELQARALDFLNRKAAELDAKRQALGVEDALLEVPGVTLEMAVKLGQAEIKSVEDLAGLVPDDIRGWFETKNGERVRHAGILDDMQLTPEQCEALILEARISAGWIEAPPVEEADAESEAESDEEEAQA
jgi:transcription termination/antitermination protein NusA